MTVSERSVRPIVDYLLALADATRLAIVFALTEGERGAAEIAAGVGRPRTRVARQISVLRRAGLLACRRDRGAVLYRLASPDVAAVCRAVCGALAENGERPGSGPRRREPIRGAGATR